MVDSLAMLFGKKKAKKAKSPVKKVRSAGTIVVRGRERKLYKGQKGGLFYRSKGVKVYVDKKTASRKHRGDARKKTHRLSPHKKKRVAKKGAMMKYGIGFGMPNLLDMMGPAYY